MPGSRKWSLSLRIPHQNTVYASRLPISATCPAHLICTHFITLLLVIINEYLKLQLRSLNSRGLWRFLANESLLTVRRTAVTVTLGCTIRRTDSNKTALPWVKFKDCCLCLALVHLFQYCSLRHLIETTGMWESLYKHSDMVMTFTTIPTMRMI